MHVLPSSTVSGESQEEVLKRKKRFHNESKWMIFGLLSWCSTFCKSCHNLGGLSYKGDWAAVELDEAGIGCGELSGLQGNSPKWDHQLFTLQTSKGCRNSSLTMWKHLSQVMCLVYLGCQLGFEMRQSPAQAGCGGSEVRLIYQQGVEIQVMRVVLPSWSTEQDIRWAET